jgi:hypothetical protein
VTDSQEEKPWQASRKHPRKSKPNPRRDPRAPRGSKLKVRHVKSPGVVPGLFSMGALKKAAVKLRFSARRSSCCDRAGLHHPKEVADFQRSPRAKIGHGSPRIPPQNTAAPNRSGPGEFLLHTSSGVLTSTPSRRWKARILGERLVIQRWDSSYLCSAQVSVAAPIREPTDPQRPWPMNVMAAWTRFLQVATTEALTT